MEQNVDYGKESELVSILTHLNDEDSLSRNAYEKAYSGYRTGMPFTTCFVLSVIIRKDQYDTRVRQLAAVLVRRILEDDKPDTCVWYKMNDDVKDNLLGEILQTFSVLASTQDSVKHIGGVRTGSIHLLAQAAKLQLEIMKREWPQMFAALFQLSQSRESPQRKIAYDTFNKIVEYAPSATRKYCTDIGMLLGKGLQDESSSAVRLSALSAFSSMIVSLETPEELEPFAAALPTMLNVLANALQQLLVPGDNNNNNVLSSEINEEACQKSLLALVDVMAQHPKFLKKHLQHALQFMLFVGECTSFETSTRLLAFEFMISTCEQLPATMKKQYAAFSKNLIPCCMKLIHEGMDPEADVEAWVNVLDSTAIELSDGDENLDDMMVRAGLTGISRIALALGGKFVLPVMLELLPSLLHDGGSGEERKIGGGVIVDYRKKRAALLSIAYIAEGGSVYYFKHLDKILTLTLPLLVADPHPMVRDAGVELVGRLCSDFHSEEMEKLPQTFQKVYGNLVLPALGQQLYASGNDQKPWWRVRLHAIHTLTEYFSPIAEPDWGDEDVLPFLEALFSGLLDNMKAGGSNVFVVDECVRAIGVICDSLHNETNLVKYYPVLMRSVLEAISNASNNADKVRLYVKLILLLCRALTSETTRPPA